MGRKLKCIIVKYRECGHDKEHKDVVVESNQIGLGKICIVC